MAIFYTTLVISYLFSFITRIMKEKKIIISVFFFTIIILLISIISGLRNSIGDTGSYWYSYELLAQNPTKANFERDPGFTIYSLILVQFSKNPQFLLLVTAFITTLAIFLIFYKYQSFLELQIFMYITSGYYTVTMNGMRQCLAAAIVFFATPLIISKKKKLFFLIVILASAIHSSTLIFIPAYFIVQLEPWSKKFIYFIILSVIIVLTYNFISPLIFALLENTQYGSYSEFNQGGSSFIRTLVNAVPVGLAYLKREELSKKNPESSIFVNFSVLNLIFVALGMYNWIFNRFTLYFQLYNFIMLPILIKSCFKGKERRVIYYLFLVCYFIFFYREQVIGLNINYTSNYLNAPNIFYNNYFKGR